MVRIEYKDGKYFGCSFVGILIYTCGVCGLSFKACVGGRRRGTRAEVVVREDPDFISVI